METYIKRLVMGILPFMLVSCASLLPTSKVTIESPWQEFDSAKVDYGKIFPGKTTIEDLNQIGFDPYKVPNIRILNATDTINIFLSNPSIRIDDLDPGVQKCFEVKARCTSYRIEPAVQDSKRIGNFWLDLFTFKRHTVSTGWEFRGLIIMVDNVVVYKDPEGGRPTIHTEDVQIKPLGPLQDAATILPGLVTSTF